MTLSVESATARMRKALADQHPDRALAQLDDPGTPPRVDRLRCLSLIYELHNGKFEHPSWPQHHPVVARWKWLLERQWLDELAVGDAEHRAQLPSDPIAAMRALAARDRLPDVYIWTAKHADQAGIVRFLSLEGGPDAGFDDLVAICQLGLPVRAKMELATNYWDEMGNGDLRAVHTTLHEELGDALQLKSVDDESTLARSTILGLLATNRALQPELLGALGLIELQAGPRSRLVVQGLRRIGAPEEALPFYEVHAEVDPRHGQGWLDNAIAPVLDEYPGIGDRIVRGAMWRSRTNAELFSGAAVAALMATSMEGASV
ncbi:MAG: iron-containing redox enzyme family protein [Pseudonocardiaceae bacterium]